MDEIKLLACQCGNINCRKVFNINECSYKVHNLYGQEVKERCCPYCKSVGFTMLKDLDFFLYKELERLEED